MKKSYFYLVFLMPLFLIALMKLCPAPVAPIPAEKKLSASEERAIAAEERRAERREARKAKKELAATNTRIETTVVTPGFGNMDYGGIRVKMTDPGMNGFLGMPGVGFEEVRIIPDADLRAFGFTPDPPMNMGFGGGFGGMPGMGFGGGFGTF